ncbi:DNA polymerase III subunit alpha [Geovibrio thiophilus]|uniref:DNA polymerase III subunit alpha n=1 Tax=Geovibrio thiophilus TaxID=139438 RepID=A0A3R5XVM0_9BACT|nr:DNA polymerase III subunit alpha [Geovibrio thiophilus]QAR32227.1 DNA polymerase III subunit alpha [Geovibrio thiophilus]
MANEFVHLHLHTQYSLLDGAIKIADLTDKIKEQGSRSVAITDHGTMYGIVDFYKKAKAAELKPILGCEVYVAPDTRFNKSYEKGEDKNHHFILLAKDNTGLANLRFLASRAQLEGFHYKPRIDKELLAQYSEGLIGLSACLAGEIPRAIMRNDLQHAIRTAETYRDILGKGNFYLEIQDNGLPEQVQVNRQLMKMSKDMGIPLVATNDCHYLEKGDHLSHEVLMCIQTQSVLSSPNRMEIHTDQLWVKSPEEMWASFRDVPEALTNTVDIAERCGSSIEFGNLHLPEYDVPDGYSIDSYLEYLSGEGLKRKLAHIPEELHREYHERLVMELKVIVMKGFAGYFLIVWDFINYAHTQKIPVGPGRGSGAGSLVAYSLGITDIDPIRFNLLFERFLNPERESMPDFDIDFCVNGREDVIRYVRRKYGDDKVAQIITFGQLLGRGSVRDVGRVLEVPLKDVDKLAKTIPESPGMTINKALKADSDLESAFAEIEKGPDILRHARKLEGLLRNAGMHAAGIVIGDKPLDFYVPLCKGQNDEVVTQFEKDTLEEVGLVKFDFLGLKNLTIIDWAVKNIKAVHGTDIDMQKLDLDDQKTYDMLSAGDTTGVFQLESEGMKNLLKKLRPECIEDVIALVALYRPGPIGSGMLDSFVKRKHGEETIDYPLPELVPILKETYGIIVYQEQVMQIAQVVGGYSLGNADILRRAMGKKKASLMEEHKNIFINGDEKMGVEGAIKKGFTKEKAEELFNLMEKFADYGFNKSHSAAYAIVAYQTAWLKANYSVEYMAALLSCELDKGEKVVTFKEETEKMGILVLPPDINESGKDFSIKNGNIRFGMGAIKNVGFSAIDSMVQNREERPYTSIYDLCERIDLRLANKKVLESLIKAGAMDSFGKNRRQHLQVLEQALEQGQRKQRMKEQGIMSIEDFLGGGDDDEDGDNDEFYPNVEEMPENELLVFEKEVLGFYVTNHPLARYSSVLDTFTVSSKDLADKDDDTFAIAGGMVKAVKHHITKTKQEKMAFITLEDMQGEVDVLVFPKMYQENIRYLEEDKIIVIKGRVSKKDDRVSFKAEQIFDPDETVEKLTETVVIKLNAVAFSEERMQKLRQLLAVHHGDAAVMFEVEMPSKFVVKMSAGADYKVKPSFALFKEIEDIFGEKRFDVKVKSEELQDNGNGRSNNWRKKQYSGGAA